MRTAFVLVAIAIALVAGIATAANGGATAAVLAVACVPIVWAVSTALGHWRGRDLWQFRAPYEERSHVPGTRAD